MNSQALKLDQFIAKYQFLGKWKVSYTDGTHLKGNKYVKLGNIIIDASEKTAQDYSILPFTFRPVTVQHIKRDFSKLFKEEDQTNNTKKNDKQPSKGVSPEWQANEATTLIRDQLADTMVRTGLLRPNLCLMEEQTIKTNFLEVVKRISKHGSLISVVDTSALRRAATSFLHKTLSNVQIWTVVPVFVMTEVQRQVNELNTIWRRNKNSPKLKDYTVLRKRPQVTVISRELNHIRQWSPVEMLTTLPEHLGQSNGQSKTDRLIIESVKNLKRDRGLHQSVYLLTGDKDMASLATLENQGSLHIDVPSLPPEINSVRYDSYNGRLLLTPIHYLLWDLAQVFSTIRIENAELARTYEIIYYSQERRGFFAYDVMEIREC